MDDACVGARGAENLKVMVNDTDRGLKQANFVVKKWTKTYDQETIKFLSYNYIAQSDQFSLRIRLNYSPKKRGARTMPDFTSIDEMVEHMKANGVTKRNVASLLASVCHDPFEFGAPYANNLKLIYRRICRLGLQWDDKISPDLMAKLIKTCSFFFKLSHIKFERKALLNETKCLISMFYLDGSDTNNGVSIICRNILPNGEEVNCLLQKKVRINSSDITTTPRSELAGAHLCSIMYSLLLNQMYDFSR